MQPTLTEKESAQLQRDMTQHMIKKICRLYAKRNFILEVRYSANPKLKNSQKLMEDWLGNEFTYKKQIGKDLGERITNAFQESFSDGFENILVLGSDIPDIDHKDHLDHSFTYLKTFEKNCVIGPADDGGYYLIGLNRSCIGKYWEELFKNISWGTKNVLGETKLILKQYNISYSLLEKLNDVDFPEDLKVNFFLVLKLKYWEKSKEEMKIYEGEKKISIILPVLNEGEKLKETVNSLRFGENIEIIVVDGGSDDDTVEIASEMEDVIVIETEKGKALQMNDGVEISTGDIVFFLHGDTKVPRHYDTIIRTTLKESRDTIMGAFSFQTDIENLFGMTIMNRVTNWRCRMLQLPYGDQGLFLLKRDFMDNGGFPEISFFEDFQFVKNIQKKGFVRIANVPAITSSRRWIKKGVFYSVFVNQLLILLYIFGVHPDRLAQLYYS